MSNTYHSAVGYIRFKHLTPIISALFEPFSMKSITLDDEDIKDKSGLIYQIETFTEECVFWDTVRENLEKVATTLGVEFDEGDMLSVLTGLAAHFKVSGDPVIASMLANVEFDDGEEANIEIITDLAWHFNDGHGLMELSIEGSVFSDKASLGGFNGGGTYATPHVEVSTGSWDAANLGRPLSYAISQGNIDEASSIVSSSFMELLSTIRDDSVRSKVAQKSFAELIADGSSVTPEFTRNPELLEESINLLKSHGYDFVDPPCRYSYWTFEGDASAEFRTMEECQFDCIDTILAPSALELKDFYSLPVKGQLWILHSILLIKSPF